jgi:surface protein
MFNNTALFNQDISNWDVSSVTNMNSMFNNASSFKNTDISSWNFSSLTSATNMFVASGLTINESTRLLFELSKNTSLIGNTNVIDFGNLPNNIYDLKIIDSANIILGNKTFGSTSKIPIAFPITAIEYTVNSTDTKFNNTNIYNPFITNGNVNVNLEFVCINNTNNKTELSFVNQVLPTLLDNEGVSFGPSFTSSRFTVPEQQTLTITNFGNSPLINTDSQFRNFIGTFDANVGQPLLNDTSNTIRNLTNANSMFRESSFTGDITNWDVSTVSDMSNMFRDNTTFNQDISVWTTSNLTNIENILLNSASFDNKSINNWELSGITNSSNALTGTNLSVQNMTELLIDLSNNPTLQSNTNSLTLNSLPVYALPSAISSVTIPNTNTPATINNTNLTLDFTGFITSDDLTNLTSGTIVNNINNNFTVSDTALFFINDSTNGTTNNSFIANFDFVNQTNTIVGSIHIGNNTNDEIIIREIDSSGNPIVIFQTTNLINEIDLTIADGSSLQIEYTNNSNNNFLVNSASFYLEMLSEIVTTTTTTTTTTTQPVNGSTTTTTMAGNQSSNKTATITTNDNILTGTIDTGSSDSGVRIERTLQGVFVIGMNNVNPSNIEIYRYNQITTQLDLVLVEQLAPDHNINPLFNTTIFQDRYLIVAGERTANQLKVITYDLDTLTLNKTTIIDSFDDIFQTTTNFLFTNNNTTLHIVFAGDGTFNYAFGEYPLTTFVDTNGSLPIETITISEQDVLNDAISPSDNNTLQASKSDLFFVNNISSVDNNVLYYYNISTNQPVLLTNIGSPVYDVISVNSLKRIRNNSNTFTNDYLIVFNGQFAGIINVDTINNTYEIKDNSVVQISVLIIDTSVSQTKDLITFVNSSQISNDIEISSIAIIPTNDSLVNTFFNSLSLYEIVFSGNEAIDLRIIPDSNIVGSINPSTRVISTDIIENIDNNNNPEYLHVSLVSPNGTNTRTVRLISIGGEVSCFLGMTKILTPNGYMEIKYLKNNDEIISGSGNIIKIKKVRKTITSDLSSLCRLPKGFLGCNEETYVSKYHAIFNPSMRRFVRPQELKQYDIMCNNYEKNIITYYNLELFDKKNDTFIANGMIVEGDNQKGINNYRRRNVDRRLISKLMKNKF